MITSSETVTRPTEKKPGTGSKNWVSEQRRLPHCHRHQVCLPVRPERQPHSIGTECAQYNLIRNTKCTAALCSWTAGGRGHHTSEIWDSAAYRQLRVPVREGPSQRFENDWNSNHSHKRSYSGRPSWQMGVGILQPLTSQKNKKVTLHSWLPQNSTVIWYL